MSDTDSLQRPTQPPTDVTYTDARAVEDGVLVDLTELRVHVHFQERPINRMTSTLFDSLVAYNSGGTETEQVAAYQALLGFIVAGATDTASDGEPAGYLFSSQHPFHGLGCNPVWLQFNGDGWTALLPEDY